MKESMFPFGYCTNVHAGPDLASAQANLKKFAVAVRDIVVPQGILPVGMWLADTAVAELQPEGECERFRDWLAEHRLAPYTLNGFPQRDFHGPVVKHAVYEPSWLTASRQRYSIDLAHILHQLLPAGTVGSISTLPLGWPTDGPWTHQQFQIAAANLRGVARELDLLYQQHGREIVLALEPEPGCVLDSVDDLIQFFQKYLLVGEDANLCRRHLTVCHDICHSAVMFEPQEEVLRTYLNHGIRIGKVQVSSAIEVPWSDSRAADEVTSAAAIWEQLRALHEPRYLHQTTQADAAGRFAALVDDLPAALQTWNKSTPKTNWRIHFHVPIFVDRFGALVATRDDIRAACQFFQSHSAAQISNQPWFTGHYEVETYAWPVLPTELQNDNLASGIANELMYLKQLFDRLR